MKRSVIARQAAALFLIASVSTPVCALDCTNGGATQGDMNECASNEYYKLDGQLNLKYKAILSCLKGDDKNSFIDAERAWLKFRDAECKFQGGASEGGSVQPLVVANCLAQLAETRNKDLDYYLSCREGDMSCPTPGCKLK